MSIVIADSNRILFSIKKRGEIEVVLCRSISASARVMGISRVTLDRIYREHGFYRDEKYVMLPGGLKYCKKISEGWDFGVY